MDRTAVGFLPARRTVPHSLAGLLEAGRCSTHTCLAGEAAPRRGTVSLDGRERDPDLQAPARPAPANLTRSAARQVVAAQLELQIDRGEVMTRVQQLQQQAPFLDARP